LEETAAVKICWERYWWK